MEAMLPEEAIRLDKDDIHVTLIIKILPVENK